MIFGFYCVVEHEEDSNTLKTLTRNQETEETFYYDINKNIIYIKLGVQGESLSLYYVVNEKGETEIATLGKNYFIE